jgi:ketosteroid isomerase-like protein
MSGTPAAQEVRHRETRRFEAMVRGDLAFLEDVLADDLTYVHATGTFESKTQFLAALRSGQLKYESFAPEELSVRAYGPSAVVTGVAQVSVQSRAQHLGFRLRFTDVYVKRENRWQMVAWQATRLPQE